MFNAPRLTSANEQSGSTKWHALKDKYKYLFAKECIPLVEDWYNQVAVARHRESFRDVAKQIHHAQPAPPVDTSTVQAAQNVPLEVHRTTHMMQIYGATLSSEGRAKARSFLLAASAADVDKFRDVFTAIGKTLAVQTTTKESFIERPVAVPVPKDRNRRKIDWNSDKAIEAMKKVENPMAGQRLPPVPGATTRKAETAEPKARRQAQELAPDFDAQCDRTFEALRDKQRANTLEGVYTVKDGCTIYQPKPRVSADTTRDRIVTSVGVGSAATWKSTTREHIRNHGFVKQEVVKPDEHPAIARVTASLGLCVPTLQPKKVGPGNMSPQAGGQ